jgi:diguanylate cyclase (GGDEF)-like protein/PAS domain S-box-containing protein
MTFRLTNNNADDGKRMTATSNGTLASIDARADISSMRIAGGFERIAATSPDIIFIFDAPSDRIVYCNARISEVLGWTTEEFESRHIRSERHFIHPDDHPAFSAWLGEALDAQGDEVYQNQHRVRHADGGWRWLRVRVAAFQRDSDGAVTQLIGTATDITEQVAMQEALGRQTTILQLILNSMTEGVIVCDAEGELLLVNRSAERLFKLGTPLTRLSQIKAMHTSEHSLQSGTRVWHQHPLSRSLAGETVVDYELSLYDRKRALSITLSHSAAPLRDTDGGIIGAVDVFRDVTETHRARQELQRAEEHFRLLVEGTTDYAIFMLDQNGGVVSWNPGAERILGFRKDEIIGRNFATFFTSEDQARGEPMRKLRQAMCDGRSEDDSWRVRKDGERFWCTGVLGALHDPTGKVKGFVEIMRDNTERRLAEQNVFYLANHDPLTGLANRARFLERLHEALLHADRDGSGCAALLLDLDRFKAINDTLGHHAGDLLLKQVAQRLLSCVRETDTVARLGGDEFVLILTRLKTLAAAELIAENIIRALSEPFEILEHRLRTGASIGIAMYPDDGNEPGELLQKADLAMYRAKSTGRNRYRVFSPGMLTEVLARQQQEEQLRAAIVQQQFELAFQPQIDLLTMQVVGAEALLRCENPLLQSLSARQLVALAEETGLASRLSEWVLEAACKQLSNWRERQMPELKVAVNVSSVQLMDPGFVDQVRDAIERHQLPAALLELELTEGGLVAASTAGSDVMESLKTIGVSLSIDDFGTGISTLSYLKHYPVDMLKVDASLVRNLPRDHEDAAIVSAIIKLAGDLRIKVIAEGVETFEQLNFLRSTSCHHVQGFLFSEALRSDKFEQLLQHRKQQGQFFH